MGVKQEKKLEIDDKFDVTGTSQGTTHVTNTVEYEQNHAIRVKRFKQYDTQVDIRFTQPWNHNISSCSAIKYKRYYTKVDNRFDVTGTSQGTTVHARDQNC